MKNKFMGAALVVAVTVLFIGAGIAPVTGNTTVEESSAAVTLDGNTLYVGGSEPGNYSSIQSAINNATDGDTVFVYSGLYQENIIINKRIFLTGEDRYSTIVNANDNGHTTMINYDRVTINKLTLKNASKTFPVGYGVKICQNSNDTRVENCIITDNFLGVRIEDSSNVTIENCIFIDNTDSVRLLRTKSCKIRNCTMRNRQFGIDIASSRDNVISNCTFTNASHDNHAGDFASNGIYFMKSRGNVVKNCRISRYNEGVSFYGINSTLNELINCVITDIRCRGIVFGDGSNNCILDSTISHTGKGPFEVSAIEFFDSSNNRIERCNISDNRYGGIYIGYSSGNYVLKCTISNNRIFGLLCKTNSNHIYHNNFIENDQHVRNWGNNNFWDDGKMGNYWDDYSGIDGDGDGIGDTPYPISDGQDRYPLMFLYGEEPAIEITTPAEGWLYIRNHKILPFFTTILFGNIKIEANAANYIHGIDRVEFYVDNWLRRTDTTPPYSWTWRLNSHIKHRHTIRVVAYDNEGNSATDEILVWKFF